MHLSKYPTNSVLYRFCIFKVCFCFHPKKKRVSFCCFSENFDALVDDFTETQKRKCSTFKVTKSLEAVPTYTTALMEDPNHRTPSTMGIQAWRQKLKRWKPGINTETPREIAESEPIATTPLFAIFFPTQPK